MKKHGKLESGHLQKVEQIFHQVFEQTRRPGSDEFATQKMLDELCGEDTGLRSAVEQLLNVSDDSLSEFMQTSDTADAQVTQIAGYRIVKLIGEGGMGSVFLAEQNNPRRQVALKTIKSGFASKEIRRRFEYEAQVLGQLQHPGIAQIFEAGSTKIRNLAGWETELPYFVMELVEGNSLTEYADENKLTIEQRLRLIMDICAAVQSAHQRGVVHRDLKPGNIMVTADRKVKILDFGLARLADAESQEVTAVSTQFGQLLGTLAYMSPEQLTGDPSQVDARCDIYSIGVVMFQLLAGRLPFDTGNCTVPETIERIRTQEPIRIASLDSRLRGDVQTMVDMLLEKDPNRRYQTASELAADIDRHLSHLPITARPASAAYQMKKMARRHAGLFVAAGLVLITMLVAAFWVSRFAMIQTRALAEAKRQNKIAEEVNLFINNDLLANAHPKSPHGKNVTVDKLVDLAAEKIEERFAGMPLVEAAIRSTIGRTYSGIGEYSKAEQQYLASRELYVEHLGSHDERTMETSLRLAALYSLYLWNPEKAEEILGDVFPRCGSKPDNSYYLAAQCHASWAILCKKTGKPTEAVEHCQQAIALSKLHDPEKNGFRKSMRTNLAMILVQLKRFEEAEQTLRDVVAEATSLHGRQHPSTAGALLALGDCLLNESKQPNVVADQRTAKLNEAAVLLQEALDIQNEFLDPRHPNTLKTMVGLAMVQQVRGDFEQSNEALETVLEIQRKVYGTDQHPEILNSLLLIGNNFLALEQYEQAAEIFESALAAAIDMPGPTHSIRHAIIHNLVLTYADYLHDSSSLERLLDKYEKNLSANQKNDILRRLAQNLNAAED